MTRLEQLMRSAAAAGIDALSLTPGTNLRHLTDMHFHHGERLMVAIFAPGRWPGFVLPAMEAKRVGDQTGFPFTTYPWSDAEPAEAALARCVGDLGLAGKTVGIEFGTMRVFELRALEGALPGCRFVDAGDVLAEQRIVKGALELMRMQEAADMIDASLKALLPRIKVGMTERKVASMWLSEVLALGAEGAAFEFIVGSGPNSALPHHATGDRALCKGDLLVLDGGARHHGYNSDITRTVALGEPEPELRKIYEVTLAANAAGRNASRPGVTGEQVDAAARAVIESAGYGPQFLHRTGHGLGLDVHEHPYIAPGQKRPLPVGAVFTVEPGIYLHGRGGVRIEDDVVLTETGHRSLTSFPRELVVLNA
jgi:Xaa-Pro dipeptidase